MDLQQLVEKAQKIKIKYDRVHELKKEKAWTVREFTQGLCGDTSVLSKLLLIKEGYLEGEGNEEKIKHEVFDCLWSILVIADELGIDLEKDFPKQAEILEAKIDKLLAEL